MNKRQDFFGKSFMRNVAFWLSLIVIFMIAWEDMISIGALGTRGAQIGGLFLAASWVAAVVVTGRFRKPHPFHLVVYLFVLWNAVSAFWSFDVEGTVARTITYFQLTALVWIVWDLYTTPADLQAGLQAYVLGSYVALGSTVANYLTGNTYTSSRVSATGFNPNNLGLMLALGIPVAWHLAISGSYSKRTHLLKLVNYAYVPAATLGILLSASRGSLVATLPAFLFVLGSLFRLKLFSRGLIFVALVGALFAVQTLVPPATSQRLGTTGTSIIEGDLNTRVYIWRAGLAVFSAHPLLGVGSGAFRPAVGIGKVAHNVFLSVLVEVGIIGFVLFAIILAITVVQAMHQPKWDSRFWLAVLLVWALGAFVHTWEQKKPTWLFLSLTVVGAGTSAQGYESRLRTESPWQGQSGSDWKGEKDSPAAYRRERFMLGKAPSGHTSGPECGAQNGFSRVNDPPPRNVLKT